MSIAFLATGDELVHGDTINSNTSHMAHTLISEGLSVGQHLLCGDDKQELVNALDYLTQQHDTIILTGGLGPTTDDITRYALAEHLKQPLDLFESALDHVAQRLKNVNVAMHEGNRQQALFPAQAELFLNPNGSACGCMMEDNNIRYFMLPGPPRECLPMIDEQVMPRLVNNVKNSTVQLKWLLFAVAESEIAEQLEQSLAMLDVRTGYRLDPPYVEFKVRCLPDLINQVKQKINPIITPHILSHADEKASSRFKQWLKTHDVLIFIEDNATAGHLQQTLSEPSLRDKIHFFDQHKNYQYRLRLDGLLPYWQNQDTNNSMLSLIDNTSESIIEQQTLPYRRSPLCIPMATEWCCEYLWRMLCKNIVQNGE